MHASIFAFLCPRIICFFLKLQIQFLFCPRNSNVGDLFVEALRSGQLDLPETGGTKKLRLLEIISNKIFTICGEEISLDVLLSAQVDNLYNFEGLSSLLFILTSQCFFCLKGTDRLCKVVEQRMQCCGQIFKDSFET